MPAAEISAPEVKTENDAPNKNAEDHEEFVSQEDSNEEANEGRGGFDAE